MKPLLSILLGFTAASGLVGTGIAGTILVMTMDPNRQDDTQVAGKHQNVAQLWSAEPRRVDTGSQQLERLPSTVAAATTEPQAASASLAEDGSAGEIDAFTTAALPEDSSAGPADPAPNPYIDDLAASHTAWCGDRYRSYRIEDDSYTPYSGGRRLCVSPWSEELEAARSDDLAYPPATSEVPVEDMAASAIQASYDGGSYSTTGTQTAMLDDMHVQDCFSRYRSYRPDDNTYQPYGGGPRLQCE